MKLTNTEKRFIVFLSKMTKISYEYLGANTLATAGLITGIWATSAIFSITLTRLLLFETVLNANKLFFGLVLIFVLVNVVLTMVIVVYSTVALFFPEYGDVIGNTRLNPNPNKYTHWLFVCRLSAPCWALCLVSRGGLGYISFIFFCCFLGVTIGLYTMCAEKPLPKQKRELKEKSPSSLVLQ